MQPNKTENEKRAILWPIDDNPHLQQMLFIPLLYEQIKDSEILKHTHTNKTRTPRKGRVVN